MPTDETESFRFDGQVVLPNGSKASVLVIGGFDDDDLTSLDLELFLYGDEEQRRKVNLLMTMRPEAVRWIESNRADDGHLEVLGINNVSGKHGPHGKQSIELDVSALQRGISETPELEARKLFAVVRMVPSGFVHDRMFGFHATGKIEAQDYPERHPIVYSTPYGGLTLAQSFVHYSGKENGNKTTRRVERLVLAGEITIPAGESLRQANEVLKGHLHEVRLALSFCFRQPVYLAQINYTDHRPEALQRGPIYFRRHFHENLTRVESDELIHSNKLGQGGLQRLVESIRNQQRSADFTRALSFLAVSYTSTLENGFFQAFSAMETIIDIALTGRGEQTLTEAIWKAIERPVRDTIDTAAKSVGFDPVDVKEKVAELRRPSFKKRVSRVCAYYKPTTDDLWPSCSFEDGINAAAKLRNGLFHGANYSESEELYCALIRIRAFTERLVLRLLGWPDSELWPHRDQTLIAMNRSSSAPPAAKGTGQAIV